MTKTYFITKHTRTLPSWDVCTKRAANGLRRNPKLCEAQLCSAADRHGRWLELSVFHIMLPVYVLPEHFPSKARKTTNICNNPNKRWFDGTEKEGLTLRCYLWLLNQPKYLTPVSDDSIASLDEIGNGTYFRLPDKALAVKESCGGLKYQSECKGCWIFFCLYVCRNADRLRWWWRGTPGPFGIDWEKLHARKVSYYMFIYGAKTICVLSGLWLKWCFIACYIDDANYSIPALQTFFF